MCVIFRLKTSFTYFYKLLLKFASPAFWSECWDVEWIFRCEVVYEVKSGVRKSERKCKEEVKEERIKTIKSKEVKWKKKKPKAKKLKKSQRKSKGKEGKENEM